MLLHILGQEYESVEYTLPEEWFPTKQKRIDEGAHFMNLPYLEDGDVLLTESGAIPYYLCQRFNKDLFGKTALDTARVIQINGVLVDLHRAVVKTAFREDAKEALAKNIKEGGAATKLFAKLSTFLGDKEFLLGYLTYADLNVAYRFFFYRSVLLNFEFEDIGPKFPNLLEHCKRIHNHDVLKGYIGGKYHPPCLNVAEFPWYKDVPLP